MARPRARYEPNPNAAERRGGFLGSVGMNTDDPRPPANADAPVGTPSGWTGNVSFNRLDIRGGLSWPARIALVAAGLAIAAVMLLLLVPLLIFGLVAGVGLWLWATIKGAARPRTEAGRVNVRVMRPGGGE